jgi:hypothetical protein
MVWEDSFKDITTSSLWFRFERSKPQLEYKGKEDGTRPWNKETTSQVGWQKDHP